MRVSISSTGGIQKFKGGHTFFGFLTFKTMLFEIFFGFISRQHLRHRRRVFSSAKILEQSTV
jgi:hypothetical protein